MLAVTLAVEVRSLFPCADKVIPEDNPNRETRGIAEGSKAIMSMGKSGESKYSSTGEG